MKRKLSKILGLSLALVLVLALSAAFAPVAGASPGDDIWAEYTIPSDDGWVLATSGINTDARGPIDVAADGTLYAYAQVDGADYNLFKSTDDGYSWESTGDVEHTIVDIACSPDEADVVYYATTSMVYKSADAGGDFDSVGASPGTTITSLDCALLGDDHVIVVGLQGTDKGVFVLDEGVRITPSWTDQEVGGVEAGTLLADGGRDVFDVALSPNFNDDRQIVATVVGKPVVLEASGDSTAAWSTATDRVHSGSYSAYLKTVDAEVGAGKEARIVIDPASVGITTLSDISSISWWRYAVAGYPAHLDITLDVDGDGVVDSDDQLVAEMAYNNPFWSLETPTLWWDGEHIDDSFGAWFQTFETTTGDGFGAVDDDTLLWVGKMGSGYGSAPSGTLAQWKAGEVGNDPDGEMTTPTISGDAPVVKLEIEIDNWVLQAETYVDDITINGVTYDLEEFDTLVTTKLGSAGWNDTIGDVTLEPGNVPWAHVVAAAKCSIAFPADYDSDTDTGYATLFVGVNTNDADDADVGGDVYKVMFDGSVAFDLGVNEDITDLDAFGPQSACDLLAGTTDTATVNAVMRSTDSGDDWDYCKKEPTGDAGKTYVRFANDYSDSGKAWAVVGGTDGGVSILAKDKVWNQIGLINTAITGINDLSFSADFPSGSDSAMFMATTGTTGTNDSIWRQAGNWERVFSSTLEGSPDEVDMVEISPNFADDETVFLANKDTTDKLLRSTDGGLYFSQQIRPPTAAIKGWVVISDDTVVVGAAGGTYKTTNNGNYWKSKASGGDIVNLVLQPGFDIDDSDNDTILAGDDAGKVFRSTNAAGSWSQLKDSATGMGGVVVPAFDADYTNNAIMYATDSLGGVYRYEKGVSSVWARIDIEGAPHETVSEVEDQVGPAIQIGSGTGLVVASDDTLYAVDNSDIGEGMGRCLDPTAAIVTSVDIYFEQVNDTVEGELTQVLDGLWLTSGSNIVWSVFGSNAVYYLEDTLTGKVTLTSPADASTSGRADAVIFEWEKLSSARKYEIQVKYGNVVCTGAPTSTTYTTTDWVDIDEAYQGVELRWRVRVYEQKPYQSNWSDYWTFTTKLVGGEWNPFLTPANFAGGVAPIPGATDVPSMPVFQWNAADWATNYEFVLADNANYHNPIVDMLSARGPTATTYEYVGDPLSYSTTYYWKVRAVKLSGTTVVTQSTWGEGIFTTMAEPVEPAPPVVITQTPAAPAPVLPTAVTPAYVWAIIAIGAVLVIAVIVLIVRSRRAV